MRDFVGVAGLAVLAYGVFGRYGLDVACIIVGGILLSLTIIGAVRK